MDLTGLNGQQNEAVINSFDKDTLLLAGAGSGKTRVITYRVGYLIEDKGVQASEIMLLTFTNKAAAEMKERLDKLNVNTKGIWSGTFHSVCVRILKLFGERIGLKNFTIIDTYDVKGIMREALERQNIPADSETVKHYLNRVSGHKNNFVKPTDILNKFTDFKDHNERLEGQIYKEYQDICWSKRYLDFDDLLIYTIVLLQQSQVTREWFHRHISYLLCDEAQDSNKCQIMLLKLLQGPDTNVFCVGDIDQSIYGFRNAKPEYFVDFDKMFANSKVLKLEENYRSTQNIIKASNNVIANNKFRLDKNVYTSNEKGERIKRRVCTNNNEEGLYVASEVKYLHDHKGLDYKDMAVLYRTNDQSRAVEDALLAMQIPYHIIGGIGFYNRKEIKDVMAFLRLKNNPLDESSFKRILKMQRGIGDKTIAELINSARSNNIDFITIMAAVTEPKRILPSLRSLHSTLSYGCANIFDFMKHVVVDTGMIKKFEAEDTDDSRTRLENVNELLSITKQNEHMSLPDYVDQIALSTKEDVKDDPDSVTLMTIHSAKGLEYESVFLVGVEENVLPHANSRSSKDVEEERRLMYVAMTRAKKNLYITNCTTRKRFDKTAHNAASRFISEIGDELMEKV